MALSEAELEAMNAVDLGGTPNDTMGVIDRASHQDPDRSARVINIADRRNVPMGVADTELDELERRDRIDALDPSTFGPELTKFLSRPDYAAIAYDDIDNLRETERILAPGTVRRQVRDFGQNLKSIAGAFAAGIPTFTSGGYGVLEQATDILRYVTTQPLKDAGLIESDPLEPVSEFFRYGRDTGAQWAEYLRPETDNSIISAMYSGLESASSNALTLGYGVAAKNSAYALGLMVGSLEGRSYGEAKDQGLGIGSATAFAVTDSVVEYYTEKIPAFQLINDLQLGTSFIKIMGRQLAAEIPGEQLATVLQDLNAWAFLPDNKDKPFSDYIAERPDAALSTLIATIVGTSVQTGVVAGISKAVGEGEVEDIAIRRSAQTLLDSQDEQGQLDTIITLAQETKVNGRAQGAYRDFLKGAGSDQIVYVPVDIVESLDEIPGFMSDQIDGLGSDIEIPMDLFMSQVAPDEDMMSVLRPHLKMGADRLSADEIEKGEDMTVRALLERAQAAADVKTEADQIWETVREQLKATGRVTDAESRLSAQLYPAYAAVAAERYGITPKEVFDRMGFKVVGPERVPTDGEVLSQPSVFDTTQDFGDIELTEDVQVEGTKDSVTIKQSAQRVFDQTMKRRNVIDKLRECLNAS